MGAQRAQAKKQAADLPDGFGVAVVREDGKWRCSPMRPAALTSLNAAETELRELRSAGAVFGLLDVDDEFFVIVRPAPPVPGCSCPTPPPRSSTTSPPRCWRNSTPNIEPDDLEDEDPFEEGDLGLLADIGLTEAVLGVILSDDDTPTSSSARIAQEMGFADEMSAVVDKLDR